VGLAHRESPDHVSGPRTVLRMVRGAPHGRREMSRVAESADHWEGQVKALREALYATMSDLPAALELARLLKVQRIT
jgi:hypothetical protein